MIFVGDIAPFAGQPVVKWPAGFRDSKICGNLEAGLSTGSLGALGGTFLIDLAGIKRLAAEYDAVNLANNHVHDGADVAEVRRAVEQEGVVCFGAGDSLSSALAPAEIVDVDGTVVNILGLGWTVIGCKEASNLRSGVAPFSRDRLLASIRAIRGNDVGAVVVAFLHWNYELERWPMPQHRRIAFEAIEAGADIIVSSHGHLPQGIEFHCGRPILYGLGNWQLPQGKFNGFHLWYPDLSTLQLAFEADFLRKKYTAHWFRYDRNMGLVTHISSSPVETDATLREFTPFSGMSETDYEKWFQRNREKNVLLPVFKGKGGGVSEAVKSYWVRWRQKLLPAGKYIVGLRNRFK